MEKCTEVLLVTCAYLDTILDENIEGSPVIKMHGVHVMCTLGVIQYVNARELRA